MMLQFDKRKNRLLSISIRVIDLEYTHYRLKIKSDDNIYFSTEIEKTLVWQNAFLFLFNKSEIFVL